MKSLLAAVLLMASMQQSPAPPIRFPLHAPVPGISGKLGIDQLFVIDADVPILVLDSPQGIVSITKDTGPLRIRAKFVDSDRIETRTFKGKHIFIVESAKTGTVELLIVPVGADDESKVIRKTLQVDAQNPQPPPDPGPKPPPDPGPKPDVAPIPVAGFRVMIVEDKVKLGSWPEAQLDIRTSPVFRDYVEANCVLGPDGKTKEYRIWDYKTVSTGQKVWQDALARKRTHSYTDASGKAVHTDNFLPWLIISNHPYGGWEGPLPANVEETIKLCRKIKGSN